MEKEKLTPLVLTLGLIIYGCTASAGQNDKIDSDRTFTVHLYSPIIGDEDRGSIYGSGYSGPYLAPGGDTEVPPDPTPSYPSINQVDDQTNALMLSSIASAAVMYAADELLIDSTMKSRQGVRQTGPFAAARIGKYDLDVAGELDTTVITGLLGYAFKYRILKSESSWKWGMEHTTLGQPQLNPLERRKVMANITMWVLVSMAITPRRSIGCMSRDMSKAVGCATNSLCH